MQKKCYLLSLCSFAASLVIFVFTYMLFHYLGTDGDFAPVYQETPVKPFVTFLFGVWGVMFLFASIMSLLIGKIFFPAENAADKKPTQQNPR